MIRNLLLFLLISLYFNAGIFAQSKYIIQLTDKKNSPYSVSNPKAYLSQKAIDRRVKYNIPFDENDFPVNPAYLNQIRNVSGVHILNTSKWLNFILIETVDSTALHTIKTFPFVADTFKLAASKNAKSPYKNIASEESPACTSPDLTLQQSQSSSALNYGASVNQIKIHNGDYLHNQGFTGKGITIAVLDAGFYQYKNIRFFDSARLSGRILGTWDFVKNEESVDEDHTHGTNCFSIIAANIPGEYVGTAPHASFYLFRTEEVATETPVEEVNWTTAAEKADSLGVDMISSSLGYYRFDNPAHDYTPAQMNGKTAITTRAANIAASKGILITNSAGNEGQSSWKHIIAPSDAKNVLAVAALNIDKQIAPFSSYGFISEAQTKPDVASVGWGLWIVNGNGNVVQGNGTSYSNPNISGLIACLWQAFPDRTNLQIIDAIRKSSDRYTTPDERYGYGIPDLYKAYRALFVEDSIKNALFRYADDWQVVYPNPFSTQISMLIKAKEAGTVVCNLYNSSGVLVKRFHFPVPAHTTKMQILENIHVPKGVYFLKTIYGNRTHTIRLIKQ